MGADPNFINLGDLFVFPPVTGRGVVKVKYKSAAKLDKKESAGKDDAITTYKGRGAAEIDIVLAWSDDDDTDDAVTAMLGDISPRGANGGTPLSYTHSDGRYQKVHNVFTVVVEDIQGPDAVEGTSVRTATIKVSSWAKPKPSGVGVGKTPNDWVAELPGITDQIGDNGNHVGGFGGSSTTNIGSNGNTVSGFGGTEAPAVKP